MTNTGGADVGYDLPSPVLCPECDETEKQRLLYQTEDVYHLRCQACSVTCAYAGAPPDGQLLDHAALMERTKTKPRPYRSTGSFGMGELIDHATFGVGYVLVMRTPPDKMEVLFSDQQRLLVCRLKAPPKGKSEPRRTKHGRGKSAATKRKWTTDPVRGAAVFDPPEPGLKQCPGCGKSVHPQNLRYPPEGKAVSCIHCK